MTSTNLSPKQLNFAHLVLACVDVIKTPLIDILDIYIKPNDLCKKVEESNDLKSGRHKLNSEQRTKCGVESQDLPVYSEFDVTLLYALIRNLCPMSLTPTKGWGKKPQETDTQPGDDIERIRLFRNENLAHANSGELEDTQFENLWKYLEDVIKRIQCFTTRQGCNTDYLQQLSNLKGRTVEIDEYTLVIKSLQEENEAMKKEKTSAIPSKVKGNSQVWHGNVDILINNDIILESVKEDKTENPDKTKAATENLSKNGQIIAETILYSFLQRQTHLEWSSFLTPCVAVGRLNILFMFYDCEHDILLESSIIPLFETTETSEETQRRVNLAAILVSWLVVNHRYLCSGLTKDMKVAYKADFFTQMRDKVDIYEKKMSFGNVGTLDCSMMKSRKREKVVRNEYLYEKHRKLSRMMFERNPGGWSDIYEC